MPGMLYVFKIASITKVIDIIGRVVSKMAIAGFVKLNMPVCVINDARCWRLCIIAADCFCVQVIAFGCRRFRIAIYRCSWVIAE
jgi:hypothetical protein